MENNRTFLIEKSGKTVVLTPQRDLGELEYDRIRDDARSALEQLTDATVKNVVIDFERTDYYGSTALEFFVSLWKETDAQGGKMVFCNVSPHEREILKVANLDRLWEICDCKNSALAVVEQPISKS